MGGIQFEFGVLDHVVSLISLEDDLGRKYGAENREIKKSDKIRGQEVLKRLLGWNIKATKEKDPRRQKTKTDLSLTERFSLD